MRSTTAATRFTFWKRWDPNLNRQPVIRRRKYSKVDPRVSLSICRPDLRLRRRFVRASIPGGKRGLSELKDTRTTTKRFGNNSKLRFHRWMREVIKLSSVARAKRVRL